MRAQRMQIQPLEAPEPASAESPMETEDQPAPTLEPVTTVQTSDLVPTVQTSDTGANTRTSSRRAIAQRKAADVVAEIHEALNRAKVCLKAAQQRQSFLANQHRTDVQLTVGEQVLLSTKNISQKMVGSDKLLPRFIGPFKVVQQINAVAYRLDLPPHMKVHDVFHVSLLKSYKPGGRTQPPPLPEIIDGIPEYEVEGVIHHRQRNNKYEYLIKWLGHGEEYNTWEPERQVQNCPDRINEYWSQVALRDERKRQSSNSDQQSNKRTKR
jgi:hypothetical protein